MSTPERPSEWAGPDGPLGGYLAEQTAKTLEAYRSQDNLIEEHANHEEDTARGGYARRQLFELIQNGADALVGAKGGGRVAVRLTDSHLYCADNGSPIDRDGVRALMFSRLSPKRGTAEIGRFGLGFKSVLGVTDSPEFFSRSGSFRFDRRSSRRRIREIAPDAERCPVLRAADPLDPEEHRQEDPVLRSLMEWATNIVRLPLMVGKRDDLADQMAEFPAEFLLFVEHVGRLMLADERGLERNLELAREDEGYRVTDGDSTSRWKSFKRVHSLSADARADRRSLDDGDEVPICWAAPLDRPAQGYFWAFFPTHTASLVAGILNAPWKTNEDRQNLLTGPYNEELIEAAAELIADALPELRTESDPARHLDLLPRRHEAGDTEQADGLRDALFRRLAVRPIVPDQEGHLRTPKEILYPPRVLTPDRGMDPAPLEVWAAYRNRPANWLHHRALTRIRLAAIDRLYAGRHPGETSAAAPRANLVQWLEALTQATPWAEARASGAAIRAAALIAPEGRDGKPLGRIVLTEAGEYVEPKADWVFLPSSEAEDEAPDRRSTVHAELAADPETRKALETLGIGSRSAKSRFRYLARSVALSRFPYLPAPSDRLFEQFWEVSRELPVEEALAIVREVTPRTEWTTAGVIRVLTRTGEWVSCYEALLPGSIVPDDGSRDDQATVDTHHHQADLSLMEKLGVVSEPEGGWDLSSEVWFRSFLNAERKIYGDRPGLPRQPRPDKINFEPSVGTGPLGVLPRLSEEGRALYTRALLEFEDTYAKWHLRHDNWRAHGYPKVDRKSPMARFLRNHGRLRTPDGIVPFADALGNPPRNPSALQALLEHPKAESIERAFDLAEPTPEFLGDQDPVPLLDVWPGLEKYAGGELRTVRLARCERVRVLDDDWPVLFHEGIVYLASDEEDRRAELQLVAEALGITLGPNQVSSVLAFRTNQRIERARAEVRAGGSDAERLLTAVGESVLRANLPSSLLEVLEDDGPRLSSRAVAEAAIATWHTDALRRHRRSLHRLAPPKQWAGSPKAVAFVRSLGFGPEWAGERRRRSAPFLDISAPYELPPLHAYQEPIVGSLREALRVPRHSDASRRGMLSMPTGSGKTRVTVQAIVEAIRDDGFPGFVLWVADRGELCEQAVEAWRQVWSSIGPSNRRLRISRMWAGQPAPTHVDGAHVVVATIQTLRARLLPPARGQGHEFLAEVDLVAFDEAHRSLAPTYLGAMEEIGLAHRETEGDPVLIGLTATPYRGHDEEDTRRLRNRYGSRRFDAGAFAGADSEEVIRRLQQERILAHADHETIEGATETLDAAEMAEMERSPWLPRSAERRIAGDVERTKRIVEAHERYIHPDWPTLVFAISVENAQTIAALLNRKGIPSRAVSGETHPAIRRRIVEEFRDGKIKTLVNYAIFREGFDAPRTRAILVARPVYSPNLYFQMIGRGLRGPRNGGSERCLILNVEDNIVNYRKALAFSELDWLWDPDATGEQPENGAGE